MSRWLDIMLDSISHMVVDIMKPNDQLFSNVPNKIKNDDQYWSYFKDCIGVIEGPHIPVMIPKQKQVPCISRKGITTQNVMIVCDFNMCFTFTWAGWEGAAHDAQIYLEVLRMTSLNFPHPPPGL